eukprot:Sspe_Gene.116825::Locus_106722_Transcript_1_1_Confidence_1.000_Length_938::g.116825::m.116825
MMVVSGGLMLVLVGLVGVVEADDIQLLGRDYMLHDDIQVEVTGGRVRPLGSVVLDPDRLWEEGKVRWYIDTTADPDMTGDPIEEDNEVILKALAHWEEKTCIRFTRCAKGSCPTPYIKFVRSGTQCSSPVGVRTSGVNQINWKRCGVGSTVHEIGHSLGLMHEQVRSDRDDYVVVHLDRVLPGKGSNFEKRSKGDVLPYDYASIMHYGAYYFNSDGRPTIDSPEHIGSRSHLSVLDVKTIDFLYNGCSAVFAAPRCVMSREDRVTLIARDRPFTVEFSALYREALTVSYAAGTAPRDRVTA